MELEKKVNFHEYFDDLVQKKPSSDDPHSRENYLHQSRVKLFERMVGSHARELLQDEIEKQWEVVGLYCVFIFKKVVGGSNGTSGSAAATDGGRPSSSQGRQGRYGSYQRRDE